MLTGILATSRDGTIGKDGQIPWRIPADMRHFREITWGHPIMMGRRTFESLGKWLPHRNHIILSRDPFYRPIYGAPPASSDYMVVTWDDLPTLVEAPQEIFVGGGAEIYQQTMSLWKKAHWTIIHADIEGDTKVDLKELAGQQWQRIAQTPHEDNGYLFDFVTLARRA